MPDPDFKITIREERQGQSIKEASAELKGLADEAKKADAELQNTAVTVTKLPDEFNDAGESGEKAHKKIQEGSKESTLSQHELRHGIHAVGHELGGIGELSMLAYGGPLAILGVLIESLNLLKEVLGEAAKQQAELDEHLQAIDDAKMQALAESTGKALTATSSLNDEEGKLQAAYDSGTSAMDARIKKYGAEADAILKLTAAKEKTREAEIDQLVAQGKLTKEQGEDQKENARLALDAAKGATDSAKLQNEINERGRELGNAQNRLRTGRDDDAITAAQANKEKTAVAAAGAKAEAESAGKEEITTFDKDGNAVKYKNAAELEARIKELKEYSQGNEELGVDDGTTQEFRNDAAALEVELKKHQAHVTGAQKLSDIATAKDNTAQSQLDTAVDQKKHDEEQLRTGADHLKQLQDQLALQTQITAEIEKQNAITAGVKAKTAQVEAFNKTAKGGGTPLEQQALQDQQIKDEASHETGATAQIGASDALTKARVLESNMRGLRPGQASADQMAQLHQLLDRMAGYMEGHAESVQSQMPDLSAIFQRIDALERELSNTNARANNNRNSP